MNGSAASTSQPGTTPRWRTLAIAILVAGVVFLPMTLQSVSLYFYVFPLFGIGATYFLQYRQLLTRPWWVTFIAITPLSVVALALDWPFSGHVLWTVVFIGHNVLVVRSRAWNWVFAVCLLHLVVMKALFQTTRDLAGAGLSAVLAVMIVLVIRRVISRPANPASR